MYTSNQNKLKLETERKNMNILIAGTGAMAFGFQSLAWKKHPDWKFFFHGSKDSATSFLDKLYRCNALVIAISTHDDGSAATDLILKAVQLGKPVVTCEKGALSEYFHELLPYLDLIGYNAACGGGSMILELLRNPTGIERIDAVANGSCNNISHLCEKGKDLDEAVAETQAGGYTDPGKKTIREIVMGELEDACKKAVIIHNLAFRDRPIRRNMMSFTHFSEDGIYQLFAKHRWENQPWRENEFWVKRLVIRIFPYEHEKRGNIWKGDPCFWMRTDTHCVVGTFIDAEKVFLCYPEGVTNCLQIQGDGIYDLAFGPGAGIIPTASAMLSDLERLLHESG